ncbi:S8 family serine peptidase [Umezawaea endophytica]|uniref:S8 family serine peptidase n=1 Tax=Umezawaea endophytica TaxID=1654476 RepID=A0A9X3AF78_9PSEU|nr:S8 family peptidase [Umezawaea endophytica]MCS7477916.1 S8 family serine peptidase [Umezawaea endophytica]
MRQRIPRLGGIIALVVSAGLVVVGAAPARTAGAEVSGQGVPHTGVTLITGDRVVVAGDRVVSYEPGPGREGVSVDSYQDGGHLHVVPQDAAALVAQGKVDHRLFDVTSLVEFGYDDARRSTVPVIVRPAAGARAEVGALAVGARLDAVGAVAGAVDKTGGAWESLRGGAVEKVWLDGKRELSLDRSTRQIGAPVAWQAGLTGRGVTVAVLDTGIDEKHPDLAGSQIAERNFTDDPDPTDTAGHGTHVASIIAGRGERYRGVAPDARLLDGKVCVGAFGGCSDSAILAGMQWAADEGAQVVNLSLGDTDTPETDPLEEAVDRLSREKGMLFVAAAGNDGPAEGSISSPGSAQRALSVGAVDRSDVVAPFSGRGPTATGGVKPDVTAPGVDIMAAKAGTTGHRAMTGTSMATPHVVGVAALLKQQHPDWSGERIKATITASAVATPAVPVTDQGFGRVDVPRALAQRVVAEPANLDLGLQRWPHEDDEKIVRDVVYRNSGTEPVVLDLALAVTGPAGEAPADLITVSPSRLTVPAGGEAGATVVADTTVPAADGRYAGALVASGGADLRTLVTVTREAEHHDYTITNLDFAGNPVPYVRTTLVDVATGRTRLVNGGTGSTTVRLPRGEYRVYASLTGPNRERVLIAQPKLSLTQDTRAVFDMREAKPVTLVTPDPAARQHAGYAAFTGIDGGKPVAFTTWFSSGTLFTGRVGPDAPDLTTSFGAQFTGAPRGTTPVTYRLHWSEPGRVPVGYERTATPSELAEMTTVVRSGGADKQYRLTVTPSGMQGGLSSPTPAGPSVDLVTAGDGVGWRWAFEQWSADQRTEVVLVPPAREVEPGHAYDQTLNAAVFGPSTSDRALVRRGDDIGVRVPTHADANGGEGSRPFASSRIALFRDGVKIGEETKLAADFRVPESEAGYRVEVESTHAESDLSTRTSGVWTFRSARAVDRPLPMSVVRFLPKLNGDNASCGGERSVPVRVDQRPGTPSVTSTEVEVSFDDGTTWRDAPIVDGAALVRHPEGAAFASLRARTVDAAGNTGEVTVVHAYRITGTC